MKLQKQWMLRVICILLFIVPAGCSSLGPDAGDDPAQNGFLIAQSGRTASIYVDADAPEVCKIAAGCLSEDIERVCGQKAQVIHSINDLNGSVIIIGTTKSDPIQNLVAAGKLDISEIEGRWESFIIQTLDKPFPGVEKALVIVGSDRRGAAFGVFDLSERIGVSPWYWWADVPVKHNGTIIFPLRRYQQGPPSVKYRGIFINDEDWGLQPWAAKTFAPEDGDIGPKTYAKVFELLLRLKANHIWPAMHDCTRAFNAFPENKTVADSYAIVMGSSHCEQMLRNNVDEWHRWQPADGSKRGDWDWGKNSRQITEYWRQRVQSNAAYDNIYTMGMRGVHDSGMPYSGASKQQKTLAMQDEVIPTQRKMLAEFINPDASKVPQIFCPYKEVLELYDLGMKLPEDITLVWPDDNHGYIRRLSDTAERARSGNSGVYYHLSYWGTPHDFLWLNSTPPPLIWEEMKKAYDYGADQVWVLNVGDIKPAEIGIDFFMQMAWDINRWNPSNLDQYLVTWAQTTFGPEYKQDIADIMTEYYQLAQARKPEHMDWSTIYPTTPTGEPEYTPIHFGDETQKRIDQYKDIENRAKTILEALSESQKDAFYQLIYYPVCGASLMNQKYLYAQKNRFYAKQQRMSANTYAQTALSAHEQIIQETDVYNHRIAGGKWNNMMDWKPRGLPVFNAPDVSAIQPFSGSAMGVIPEGQDHEFADNKSNNVAFFDDFRDEAKSLTSWKPMNPAQWDIRSFGQKTEYAIKSTDYPNQSGDRLGEVSILDLYQYDNFRLSCLARSCDDLRSNTSADFALVFGYIDQNNYNYVIFSSNAANSALHRVTNGTRTELAKVNAAIPDDDYHPVEIIKTDREFSIFYKDQQVLKISEDFPSGKTGIGSYNDSAAFTDISIKPVESSAVNLLPVFDNFTKQRHFIDIFNKGDAPFEWSALPSKSWIRLSENTGTVTEQQRIWVEIDWNLAPKGDHQESIQITGTSQTAVVEINMTNPDIDDDNTADFVQTGGYVSIEAEHFTNKVSGSGADWYVIPALGRSGDSVMVLPTTTPGRTEISDILANSPALQYEIYFTQPGTQEVTVYCLPTHAITSEHGLRYAVSFDDNEPQIIDYDTKEWSAQWKVNVLQGIAISKSSHQIDKPGKHTLNIRMVDPGVVIDKIVIGNPPDSYLGPPETKRK